MKESRNGGMLQALLFGGGSGSGGATSLNDLSDVIISEPRSSQTLVCDMSGERNTFRNQWLKLGELGNVNITGIDKGKALLCNLVTADGTYHFDFPQCAESPNYSGAEAQAVVQIITLLKQNAKASGKAGTKVSADAAGMLSFLTAIADTKKRIPLATFGDYTFYPKGRISTNKMLFSCADTDADGLYDITVAVDSVAGAVYVTVEYTACPAMS